MGEEKTTFENGNHPDFKIILPDEKGLISVDTIRDEIVSDAKIKPIKSEYKAYIIDDADLMNTNAQNALLKTLEEPPEYMVIVLVTSKYYSLLDTIRSRAQNIAFRKLTEEEIMQYVSDNNIQIDLDKDLFLELVDGSISNIQRVLENVNSIKELMDFKNNIATMNFIQANEFAKVLVANRENIFEILGYMEIIFKGGTIKDANIISYIEDCISSISKNINFEICIDSMVFKIWEEIHA